MFSLLVVGVIFFSFSVIHAEATPSTKLDVILDCPIGGCGDLDMTGPSDQGFVIYNQDDITGDLRIVAKLQKSGKINSTYTVFLTCGPTHVAACNFIIIDVFSTNIKGTGNTGDIIVPKCTAESLITHVDDQAHIDILAGFGDTSDGVFVSSIIDFDPTIGPSCSLSPIQ
jgi:hypothetical protein